MAFQKVFLVIATLPNGQTVQKHAAIGGGSDQIMPEMLDDHYQRHPVFPPGSKWQIFESSEDVPKDLEEAVKRSRQPVRRHVSGGQGMKPHVRTIKAAPPITPLPLDPMTSPFPATKAATVGGPVPIDQPVEDQDQKSEPAGEPAAQSGTTSPPGVADQQADSPRPRNGGKTGK